MSASLFAAQFSAVRAGLPGNALVDAQRAAAFERFSRAGLPSRQSEHFRYTDLSALQSGSFDLSLLPRRAAATELRSTLESRFLGLTADRAVIIDGEFSPEASNLSAEPDYRIESLASRLSSAQSELPADHSTDQPLALLNAAFVRDGLVVHVRPGARPERPLLIVLAGTGLADLAIQPRVILKLDRNSTLTVVLQILDLVPAQTWTNLVVQIDQAPGSTLTMHRLQEHGSHQYHTSLIEARLSENARFAGGLVDLGGHLVRNDFHAELTGTGASVDLFGVFLATDGNHVDEHIRVDHVAPGSSSNARFRGIVGAKSRGVFNGKVVVHRDAQRIDARQRSDNLLLDETAEVDTKPELEIYADDVKCSHGATVGELDERQLFYLQSRGIDAGAARALLTFAFANAPLADIEDPQLRASLAERVAERLPEHERWEELA